MTQNQFKKKKEDRKNQKVLSTEAPHVASTCLQAPLSPHPPSTQRSRPPWLPPSLHTWPSICSHPWESLLHMADFPAILHLLIHFPLPGMLFPNILSRKFYSFFKISWSIPCSDFLPSEPKPKHHQVRTITPYCKFPQHFINSSIFSHTIKKYHLHCCISFDCEILEG